MSRMIYEKTRVLRKVGKCFAMALALVCLIGALFVPAVQAAEAGRIALKIKQNFTRSVHSVPTSEEFTYRLTPKQASNPMPAGSGSSGYTFTVSGSKEAQIDPIHFPAAGIYTYELCCIAEAKHGYTTDSRVYTIEIVVTNDMAVLAIFYQSNGTKISELMFNHTHEAVICVDPPVQKTVTGNPAAPALFTFRLTAENPSNPMPAGSVNGIKRASITGVGAVEFGTWSYVQEGTYNYTISEENLGTAGYTYDTEIYTIKDVVTFEDGKFSNTRTIVNKAGAPVTICQFTNQYSPSEPVTCVNVQKVWAGGPPDGAILVQLYRDGVPYGDCVTLSASNQWRYTWGSLPADAAWTVDEFNVAEGWTKAISGSASDGFVITNTRKLNAPSTMLITGSKTWDHGSNPTDKQPKSISIRINANGVFILQKRVSETEHWAWSIRMDKNDKNGNEIVYTMDETTIENYIKTVNGFNILNAFRPGSTGPGRSDGPKTDDDSNLVLWLSLMGLSFVGLAAFIITVWRLKRRDEEKNSRPC